MSLVGVSSFGNEDQLAQYYKTMNARGKVMVEYVWVGGSGCDLRSKSRVLDCKPLSVDDLPIVKFDGSLTDQASINAFPYNYSC